MWLAHVGVKVAKMKKVTVKTFRVYSTKWQQVGADIDGEAAGDESGNVALSANGKRVAIGAPSNGDGGAWAGHVRIFSTPKKPSAPTITSVSGGNQTLSITFTAGDNGDSPISNYLYSTDGTTYTPVNPAATTSPITITGLTNGTTYSVTLKAVNALGESVASNSVNGAPVAASVTTTTPTTTVAKATRLPATGSRSSTMGFLAGFFVATGLVVISRRRFVH
jgi:LPXTG-motif cell wall-anchored protein